ncbi:alpha/beta fold hydrolase [Micromonospora maritima]|uniref:alpha/beta fold hydrolase n=1 Tax=Micromonospora maritima TaxID=986711 RepID=UPI001FE827AE|nr:alpha/beta fold hydrolase [Micromonospora maritima]
MGDTTGTRHLVLLHGMGATGEVWLPWAPLLERRWPGRWLAPDLAGHGWSPPLSGYSFAALAQRVVDGLGPVTERLGPRDRLVLLGHSLGAWWRWRWPPGNEGCPSTRWSASASRWSGHRRSWRRRASWPRGR